MSKNTRYIKYIMSEEGVYVSLGGQVLMLIETWLIEVVCYETRVRNT